MLDDSECVKQKVGKKQDVTDSLGMWQDGV